MLSILTGVRWYLAYPLSYRNLEEMMGLCCFAGKSVLDASIWHKPNQCNQYVETL